MEYPELGDGGASQEVYSRAPSEESYPELGSESTGLESKAEYPDLNEQPKPEYLHDTQYYSGFSKEDLQDAIKNPRKPAEEFPELGAEPKTKGKIMAEKIGNATIETIGMGMHAVNKGIIEPLKEGVAGIVETVSPPLDEIYRNTPLIENEKTWIQLGELLRPAASAPRKFITGAVDVVNSMDAALGAGAKNLMQPQWLDQKYEDLDSVESKKEVVPPTYLSTDIIGKGTTYSMDLIGEMLQKGELVVPTSSGFSKYISNIVSDPKNGGDKFWQDAGPEDMTTWKPGSMSNAMGEWIQGLQGVGGVSAGLATAWFVNPLQFVKLGALTPKGIHLEKLGAMSEGIGLQASKAERALLQFAPDVPGLRFIKPKTIVGGAKVLGALEEAAIKIGSSDAVSWIRNFTTYTGLRLADDSIDALNQAKHGIAAKNAEDMGTFYVSWAQKGVDLGSKENRAFLYEYSQAPAATTLKYGMEPPLPYEQADTFFNQTKAMLVDRVEKLRSIGVEVAEFEPNTEMTKLLSGKYSERYFPVGATASDVHLKALGEIMGDAEQAAKIVDEAPVGSKGALSQSQSVFKQKTKLTKDAANALISEATGGAIPEFFYDDPTKAVFEKLNDLDTLYAKSVFKRSTEPLLKSSKDEWQAYIALKQAAVSDAKAAGQIPSAYDLRIANMSMKNVRQIDQAVWGVGGRYAPDSVATAIEETLKAPSQAGVARFIGTWMKAQKANWFFSPGFVLRNAYANTGRYMSTDATVPKLVSAWTNMMFPFRKSLSVKNIETIDGLMSEQDIMRRFYQAGGIQAFGSVDLFADGGSRFEAAQAVAEKAAKDALKKVRITKSMLDMPGPEEHALSILHRNSVSGNINQLFDVIGKQSIQDNLLYRATRIANEAAEGPFRYAYYRDLVTKGYTHEMAMKKAGNLFMNFNQVRGAVRTSQLISPFINFQIKNVESLVSVLQKPQAVGMVGPGGAIERAITAWSGWSPNGAKNIIKALDSPYNAYSIPSQLMPGADALLREKDFVKKMIANHFGPDFAGWQLMVRLPSDIHALDFMSPDQYSQEMSPFMRVAFKMLGTDPTTGDPMHYSAGTAGIIQRAGNMISETNPFKFSSFATVLKDTVDKAWPEYEQHVLNLGLDPKTHKIITDTALKFIGAQNNVLALDDKTKKAISRYKSLFVGNLTQLDVDYFYRTNSDLKHAADLMRNIGQLAPKLKDETPFGPRTQMAFTIDDLRKTFKGMKERSEFLEEWRDRLKAVAPEYRNPIQLEIPDELQDESKAEEEGAEVDPSQEVPDSPAETDSFLQQKYLDATSTDAGKLFAAHTRDQIDGGSSRAPASAEKTPLERVRDLNKKYLLPIEQVTAEVVQDPEVHDQMPTGAELPPDIKSQDIDPIDEDLDSIEEEIQSLLKDNVPDESQANLISELMGQKINLLHLKLQKHAAKQA